MNTNDINLKVKYYVDWLYDQLAIRPHVFAGRCACSEAFVAGVEAVLNGIAGDDGRPDSYAEFRNQSRFGAESFSARFERQHDCKIAFTPIDQPALNIEMSTDVLEEEFRSEFEEHWKTFLAWRAKQRGC